MALIGYARVSTDEQDTAAQQDALRSQGCSSIFEDKASGASKERPNLARALERVGQGDTLLVVRIDRLARSLSHLLEIVETLRAKGAYFRSINDPIDTSSAQGMLMTQMLGAFAEFGLSALLGHGYTVDNRAQPEMATFGVFRRRVPPIAMQNRRLPLDHWGQVVVRSDFR